MSRRVYIHAMLNTTRNLVPLLAITAIACGGAAADPDAPLRTYEERGVLWADVEAIEDYMDAGNSDVIFVDNRNAFAFEQLRIAGSRLIATSAMARSVGTLPLNQWIVLYCT